MAATFVEGDRVKITDRDATAEDMKSGLFFNHLRGLVGTIQKVYPANEAAITVDQSTLSEPMLARHLEIQEQMKAKWLDPMSDDARSRLTPKEREFAIRYTVLVALKDISPA